MENPQGKTRAGVWIDHRTAIVVRITDQGEETRTLLSKVERHPERAGDSPLKGSHEAQNVPSDDSLQRSFTGHLNAWYDEVIASVANADSILILGPGEAKGELGERMERSPLRKRIVGIETVDKMTGPQIAARVRKDLAR